MNFNRRQLIFLAFAASIRAGYGWTQSSDGAFLTQQRIVGGTNADRGEFPHQVSIRVYSAHSCGGALLKEDMVLTAAHCCLRPENEYSVVVGEYDIYDDNEEGEQLFNVVRIIKHEEFNFFELLNDICIMVLDGQVQPVPGLIELVTLDDGSREPDVGETLTISGWGTTSEGGSVASILQKAGVPYVSNEECEAYYQNFNPITSSMLCAGFQEGGVDACQGDSGGPIMFSNNVQVGLTSWGNGCARPNYPGVYTRISSFNDWIALNSGSRTGL